jgi:hypothetical protein
MPISFTISLSDKDWNTDHGGWNCSALSIPSAEVTELRADGVKQDDKFYKVDSKHKVIEWTGNPRPERALVSIDIVKDLTPAEKVDEARVTAIKETTDKWKNLTIIFQVIGTIVVALITAFATIYVSSQKTPNNGYKAPKVQLKFPGNNLTLNRIREITAIDQKARIEFRENCKNTTIPESIVTTANATISGNDVGDFFQSSIKPRASNKSFCVIEIAKDNSYEIECKPCPGE